MSDQLFDTSKMDYAALRRQKRIKLLSWSAPVVVAVLLLASWFILPSLLTGRAIPQYKHGQYATARGWITPLTWTSPQPFVAAYNSGTADAAQKKYDRSEKELTRALALAPKDKRCMVAHNLVFALKAHADSLTNSPSKSGVEALTKQSDNVISSNKRCFKGAASSGGGGSSSSSTSDSQSPSDSQQQQLQQKEQEGKDRQAQFARDEQYNPDDPSIKPW